MASVNKVILIGNLGKDPETKYIASGKPVTNFSIATSESWKDKTTGQKQEKTEWHNITAFDNLAEICAKYLKKGSTVYVEGKLTTEKWTDKTTGAERQATKILLNAMTMLGGKKEGHSEDDDIPF